VEIYACIDDEKGANKSQRARLARQQDNADRASCAKESAKNKQTENKPKTMSIYVALVT
jgi:hypothetical protein